MSISSLSLLLALVPMPAPVPAMAALHQWDTARAAAYVHDDPDALAHLYVDGAPAGRRDRALLRSYDRAGVRITSMTTQIFDSRVRAAHRSRIVVDLVDRVVATGVDGRRCRWLPASSPQAHRVTLLRRADRWVVGAVRVSRSRDRSSGRP